MFSFVIHYNFNSVFLFLPLTNVPIIRYVIWNATSVDADADERSDADAAADERPAVPPAADVGIQAADPGRSKTPAATAAAAGLHAAPGPGPEVPKEHAAHSHAWHGRNGQDGKPRHGRHGGNDGAESKHDGADDAQNAQDGQ